jgi:FkbM family methyltransferase
MAIRSVFKQGVRAAWGFLPKNKRVSWALAVIRQAATEDQRSIGIATFRVGLSLLRANGFHPGFIIDVGANRGDWTIECRQVFPDSSYFLVDADPANVDALKALCSTVPDCRYSITLLGAQPRDGVMFYQMGTGSSVLSERTQFERRQIQLPMTTLDTLLGDELRRPVLLKLDVQGYELEVLRGGNEVLAKTDVVIAECALVEYNTGSPVFADVVAFMKERGFVVYDFCGQIRRQEDGVLSHTDVIFTREDAAWRRPFGSWHHEGSSD